MLAFLLVFGCLYQPSSEGTIPVLGASAFFGCMGLELFDLVGEIEVFVVSAFDVLFGGPPVCW